MKQFTFKIFTFLFSIIFIYIFFFLFYLFIPEKKIPSHFKSVEQINFHKKYSNQIHHIRDQHALNYFFKKDDINDLLFSRMNEMNEKNKTVLLQGDSWIDQIIFSDDGHFDSLEILKKFGLEKKIEFINGGISSFSPSLMSLQLEILEKDFDIKPDIVVAYIDQTDIGDENCRYKNKKTFIKEKLQSIKPERFSNTIWDYTKIYEIIRISLEHESKFFRTFHKLNFNIKHTFLRLVTKINYKFKNQFKKEESIKCHFSEIEKYLIDPKKKHTEYFSYVVNNYIEKLTKKKHIKKIFIVTFPHKKHFKKKIGEINLYNFNVSDIIESNLTGRKKITHINFSEILLDDNNFDYKSIWKDDGIHLKNEIHAEIFVKKILKNLNEFLEDSQ